MKKKKVTPCPELTLPKRERRKRARKMAKVEPGCNLLTKRQVQRLPSKQTPHAVRQEKRLMKRYMHKQGMVAGDLA